MLKVSTIHYLPKIDCRSHSRLNILFQICWGIVVVILKKDIFRWNTESCCSQSINFCFNHKIRDDLVESWYRIDLFLFWYKTYTNQVGRHLPGGGDLKLPHYLPLQDPLTPHSTRLLYLTPLLVSLLQHHLTLCLNRTYLILSL